MLAKNDDFARRNRHWLARRGVIALNIISAPGAGKTLLLERTLEALRRKVPCAVITGDQYTDNDARRLAGKGARVAQIETMSACHLDAGRIAKLLPKVVGPRVRLLFIENVGNLVCPAAFDLGEHAKIALLSVTEGEDKPEKYPALFIQAGAILLTKVDLLPHLQWDRGRCQESLRHVHPAARVMEVSARTGLGMDGWVQYLRGLARR